MQIIPTIWTSDVEDAVQKVAMLQGVVKEIQFDISDGKFVEKVTVTPGAVDTLPGDFKMEVHLMVEEPIDWLDRCFEWGVARVIAQVEMMKDQQAFVDMVLQQGFEVGLALNSESPLSAIDAEVWVWLDRVLVMGYQAGIEGQSFEEKALDKIAELRDFRSQQQYGFMIEVDGGVNVETVQGIAASGADVVAVGSAIYQDGQVRKNLQRLQELAG